ncbi:FAD-binding oxidoreductase [Haliscomenobacter sp.]|uniref:FAD-binding oxidoreductase n=1 Tax=Haliscomenobacter sp. TaxID=2717303 RepID=UPI0035939A70
MDKKPRTSRIMRSNEPGFEAACMDTLFNKRTPINFPEILFQVHRVEDILEAIQLAKAEGLKVSVVSGGHSWSANHMRKNSLVIDMSFMNAYAVDKPRMQATAEPGCYGHTLMSALVKQGLFFPTGHCKGVCLGGYLLKGGFGWHSVELGLACENVVGLDIVTADGRIVHASDNENPDLFWAARGAGSGFFGVVFRYHLKLYRRPGFIGLNTHIYKFEHMDEVVHWMMGLRGQLSDKVELKISITRKSSVIHQPSIDVGAFVFADSWAEARAVTKFMHDCPIKKKASLRIPLIPVTMGIHYYLTSLYYPDEQRWAVDNIWTHAQPEDLLPSFHQLMKDMPPEPSFLHFEYWAGAARKRLDMAFSMEDDFFLTAMAAWKNPADDERHTKFITEEMQKLEPFATGTQLADENLNHRTSKFMSTENLLKLDKIRAKWDTDRLFHEWHSRPTS